MSVYLDPFAFDSHREPWHDQTSDVAFSCFLATVSWEQMSLWERRLFTAHDVLVQMTRKAS